MPQIIITLVAARSNLNPAQCAKRTDNASKRAIRPVPRIAFGNVMDLGNRTPLEHLLAGIRALTLHLSVGDSEPHDDFKWTGWIQSHQCSLDGAENADELLQLGTFRVELASPFRCQTLEAPPGAASAVTSSAGNDKATLQVPSKSHRSRP